MSSSTGGLVAKDKAEEWREKSDKRAYLSAFTAGEWKKREGKREAEKCRWDWGGEKRRKETREVAEWEQKSQALQAQSPRWNETRKPLNNVCSNSPAESTSHPVKVSLGPKSLKNGVAQRAYVRVII